MRKENTFVGQPIRSLQTMLRVISLDNCSLPPVVPDGIYGNSTMQAVSAFQRCHSLPVTGIADGNTWEQIVQEYEHARINHGKAQPIEVLTAPGRVFRAGEEDPYIYLAQGMLSQIAKDLHCVPEPTHTGAIDEGTAAGIREFQKICGLPETGDLDRITWQHLVHHFTLSADKYKK